MKQPSPLAFAVLVAILLLGTAWVAAWAETPYAPEVEVGVDSGGILWA